MIFRNRNKNSAKVFCIGGGKTGTTSIEKALKDFGYKMGDQAKGELLLNAYAERSFEDIVRYCESAEAFQDAPFCFKHTFIALDQAYPNAKFILTIRDSQEQWYNSLVKFHSKLITGGERVPTVADLKNFGYRYKGYVWDVRQKVFGFSEQDDPYDETKLKDYYTSHNNMVLDYFKNKSNLLVLNVAETDSYKKLCEFLDQKPLYTAFPWENKTSDILKKI